MEILVTEKHDQIIISIEGEIDLYNVDRLREQINTIVDKGPSSVVIDMRNVYLIDSTVIAALFATQKKIEALKGQFHLANMQEAVENIIALTGIKFKTIELKEEGEAE